MKFDFNPGYTISYDEKQVLKNFSDALDSACNKVNNCGCCPMKSCCDTTNVPAFVYEILETLGLY